MCWGSPAAAVVFPGPAGLSPRVRGKRLRVHHRLDPGGSIPACAGEASVSDAAPGRRRVYPRVCGGSRYCGKECRSAAGLSPRVRGKLRHIVHPVRRVGSIPACAGEAGKSTRSARIPRVYPRVCGGSNWAWPPVLVLQGLSLRVRGKRLELGLPPGGGRSIPACAGEAQGQEARAGWFKVYPRVCGGSRSSSRNIQYHRGLSPRVRGKRRNPGRCNPGIRSIPACAGEA